MYVDSTSLDTVSLETIVSDITNPDYVKMADVQFKVVFLDIPENVDSLWNLIIANLECIANSAMKGLEIRKELKK